MRTLLQITHVVTLLAASAVACGGRSALESALFNGEETGTAGTGTGGSGGSNGNGGGTGGNGSGTGATGTGAGGSASSGIAGKGTTGSGVSGGPSGSGISGAGFTGAVGAVSGGTAGVSGGSGGNDGATGKSGASTAGTSGQNGHLDASVTDGSASDHFAPPIFDSSLPDSADSLTESFDIIFGNAIQIPLFCPTSHWEFSVPSTATVTLRNVGSEPLPYIAEPTGYIGGVVYTPGVPTSQQDEEVGVLGPGDGVNLTLGGTGGDTIALVGSSKPFSIYDGGFAPADEWTITWPMGVDGSGGSPTMYVADIEWDSACAAVQRQ